jgi:hypothetical protein
VEYLKRVLVGQKCRVIWDCELWRDQQSKSRNVNRVSFFSYYWSRYPLLYPWLHWRYGALSWSLLPYPSIRWENAIHLVKIDIRFVSFLAPVDFHAFPHAAHLLWFRNSDSDVAHAARQNGTRDDREIHRNDFVRVLAGFTAQNVIVSRRSLPRSTHVVQSRNVHLQKACINSHNKLARKRKIYQFNCTHLRRTIVMITKSCFLSADVSILVGFWWIWMKPWANGKSNFPSDSNVRHDSIDSQTHSTSILHRVVIVRGWSGNTSWEILC